MKKTKVNHRKTLVPPDLIARWSRDLRFKSIIHEVPVTRKKLEWQEGFREYYDNMKKEIAEIKDSRIRQAFRHKLETLKEEIETTGATSWSGIYLIQTSA